MVVAARGRPVRWAATMFSLTNQLLEASSTPDEILAGVLASGIAEGIEIDAAQHFRCFPSMTESEAKGTGEILERFEVVPTLLGAYLDRSPAVGVLLDDRASIAQLEAQIDFAASLGFIGIRVPLGLLSDQLLAGLIPSLERTGVLLLQEFQGVILPDSAVLARQREVIDSLGSDRLGLLLDISISMPALPVSYILAMENAEIPDAVVQVVLEQWGRVSPVELRNAIDRALGRSRLDGNASALLLTSHSRFGSSAISEWREVLPSVNSIHLKFWDTDDSASRVSAPISDLRHAMAELGYAGFWCSEWGGHEWATSATDAIEMMRAHREIFESTDFVK